MKGLFFLSLLVLFSCKSKVDTDYIKSKKWVHEDGFIIGEGDFVLFPPGQDLFRIEGDTIFYRNKPRAIILELDRENYSMKIRSMEGIKGRYRDIDESLRKD